MQKVLFILGELTDDDIDWIIATGTREEITAGTILIQQGGSVNALYILLDGILTVSIKALEEKEVARLLTGDVVGEMSFVDTRPTSATVKALADSLVFAVSKQELATKLQVDVGFSARFYRALAVLLSNRLRGTMNQPGDSNQLFSADDTADTLNFNASDNSIAVARFDWLLRRLRGSG